MTPLFITGQRGDLFCVHFPPSPGAADRGDLILAPPFAEELNRARVTIAAQARALQQIGFGVLLLDLYGTGDSAGEFSDARWEYWRADLASAANWLNARGRTRIGLWGVRLGGLLAVDAAAEWPDRFERLLLWDPPLTGKDYIDRFLQIAAASPNSASTGITKVGDRIRVDPTAAIEVAGYPISRSLMHGISRTSLAVFMQGLPMRIDWLDLRDRGEHRLFEAQQMGARPGSHAPFAYHQMQVQPFWAVQDVRPDAQLLQTTCEMLEAAP